MIAFDSALFSAASSLIGLAVFVIPGFVTSTIINQFYIRRPKDTFDKTAESLIFSFISYSVSLPLYIGIIQYRLPLLVYTSENIWPAALAVYTLTLGISIVLGIILGTAYDKDWFNKILKRTTSNSLNLWVHLFSRLLPRKKVWCLAELKDGKIFVGNLQFQNYQNKELFLEPVYLVKSQKQWQQMSGGMYLTYSRTKYIQIIDEGKLPVPTQKMEKKLSHQQI